MDPAILPTESLGNFFLVGRKYRPGLSNGLVDDALRTLIFDSVPYAELILKKNEF